MSQAIADFQDLTESQTRVIQAVESDQTLTDTFYLTGGTLLKARGIVPRESNDLDFFTFAHIDSFRYTQQLSHFQEVLRGVFGADQLVPTDRGFQDVTSHILIDVVADATPNIDDFISFGRLTTASLKDLAAHKASAICSRDEVKDYIDIAFLTRHQDWSLQDLEKLAEEKFKLGTITEEKLVTELLAKREAFVITPNVFLREGQKNATFVTQQIDNLLKNSSL